MGKAVLFAVVAFMMISAYQLLNFRDGSAGAGHRLSDHQFEVLARNAAVTGYNVAKQALADDFESTTISGAYGGSSYEAIVTVTGETADLAVHAVAVDAEGREHGYHVQATVEEVDGGRLPESVPPHMEYALITDGNLNLNGNVNAYVDPEAGAVNANFHTNGNLHVNGASASVEGFGYYVGNATSNPGWALETTFQPNENPAEDPTVWRVSEVEIPAFDSDAYRQALTVDQTTEDDVTISGTLNLGGTRSDPYIWYIDGNLRASGSTVVYGYVLFIVEGNIDLTGNVTIGETGYLGPDESSVGFYTKGNVEFTGNVSVYGQIYANGNLIFRGTPDLYGSATAKGNAEFSGTPAFHFRPASPALTTMWGEPERLLQLTAYSEY